MCHSGRAQALLWANHQQTYTSHQGSVLARRELLCIVQVLVRVMLGDAWRSWLLILACSGLAVLLGRFLLSLLVNDPNLYLAVTFTGSVAFLAFLGSTILFLGELPTRACLCMRVADSLCFCIGMQHDCTPHACCRTLHGDGCAFTAAKEPLVLCSTVYLSS